MELFIGLITMTLALILGAMSPGPSFLLVARTSLAKSRQHGLAAALGMGIGGVIFALIAVLGLLALLLAVPVLYTVLKLVGGVYLLYLAWQIWRGASKPFVLDEQAMGAGGSLRGSFLQALFTQLSNPKTAIAYASIFASLLPKDAPVWVLVALPLLLFVIEFGWYALVALLLSKPRARSGYLAWRGQIDRLAGFLIGMLGGKLLWDVVSEQVADSA